MSVKKEKFMGHREVERENYPTKESIRIYQLHDFRQFLTILYRYNHIVIALNKIFVTFADIKQE